MRYAIRNLPKNNKNIVLTYYEMRIIIKICVVRNEYQHNESTKIRKEGTDMYQMIRKGGIGERAEPISYLLVRAHFYVYPVG